MGKGISRIYIYDQRNCVYTSANNHVVIPQHYDTSIKTQHNSAFDDSVTANYVASYGLY